MEGAPWRDFPPQRCFCVCVYGLQPFTFSKGHLEITSGVDGRHDLGLTISLGTKEPGLPAVPVGCSALVPVNSLF